MHSKFSLRYVFEENENYPAEEFLGLQLSKLWKSFSEIAL